MALNRIWSGLDANVLVYHLNPAGQRINSTGGIWVEEDGPMLDYCFFQNTTLSASVPNSRRPVTGRPQKKIVVHTEEFDFEVEHFYASKTKELSLDQIFHREKILELVLQLITPENPSDTDIHTLKFGKRINFSIAAQENGVFSGSAKFIAEQMI